MGKSKHVNWEVQQDKVYWTYYANGFCDRGLTASQLVQLHFARGDFNTKYVNPYGWPMDARSLKRAEERAWADCKKTMSAHNISRNIYPQVVIDSLNTQIRNMEQQSRTASSWQPLEDPEEQDGHQAHDDLGEQHHEQDRDDGGENEYSDVEEQDGLKQEGR